MTGRATLPAFVSQVCRTVASFERPFMELQTLADGSAVLLVTSASHYKVREVAKLALGAGLDVSNPLLLVLPHAVIRVPAPEWSIDTCECTGGWCGRCEAWARELREDDSEAASYKGELI